MRGVPLRLWSTLVIARSPHPSSWPPPRSRTFSLPCTLQLVEHMVVQRLNALDSAFVVGSASVQCRCLRLRLRLQMLWSEFDVVPFAPFCVCLRYVDLCCSVCTAMDNHCSCATASVMFRADCTAMCGETVLVLCLCWAIVCVLHKVQAFQGRSCTLVSGFMLSMMSEE